MWWQSSQCLLLNYHALCLSVCPLNRITFEPISRFMKLSTEIKLMKVTLVLCIFPAASTSLNSRRSKFWGRLNLATVNVRPWNLYSGRSSKDEQLSTTQFFEKRIYERGGRLKVRINFLHYRDNSWIVTIWQMKFGAIKDYGHNYKFHFNHYIVWRNF
jgi:hypothetical protein